VLDDGFLIGLEFPPGRFHQQVYMLLNLLQQLLRGSMGASKRHGPFRVVSRLLQEFDFWSV